MNVEKVKESLIAKLRPERLKTSGKMTAYIAYILTQHGWTEPEVIEINYMVHDKLLNVISETENYIESYTDLKRNWDGILDTVNATEDEREVANHFFCGRILGVALPLPAKGENR